MTRDDEKKRKPGAIGAARSQPVKPAKPKSPQRATPSGLQETLGASRVMPKPPQQMQDPPRRRGTFANTQRNIQQWRDQPTPDGGSGAARAGVQTRNAFGMLGGAIRGLGQDVGAGSLALADRINNALEGPNQAGRDFARGALTGSTQPPAQPSRSSAGRQGGMSPVSQAQASPAQARSAPSLVNPFDVWTSQEASPTQQGAMQQARSPARPPAQPDVHPAVARAQQRAEALASRRQEVNQGLPLFPGTDGPAIDPRTGDLRRDMRGRIHTAAGSFYNPSLDPHAGQDIVLGEGFNTYGAQPEQTLGRRNPDAEDQWYFVSNNDPDRHEHPIELLQDQASEHGVPFRYIASFPGARDTMAPETTPWKGRPITRGTESSYSYGMDNETPVALPGRDQSALLTSGGMRDRQLYEGLRTGDTTPIDAMDAETERMEAVADREDEPWLAEMPEHIAMNPEKAQQFAATQNWARSTLAERGVAGFRVLLDQMTDEKRAAVERTLSDHIMRQLYGDNIAPGNRERLAAGGSVRPPAPDALSAVLGGDAQGGDPMDASSAMILDPAMGLDAPTDSVPATVDGQEPVNLDSGEFVFPKDVVMYLGTEKLQKMIEKARQAMGGGTPESQAEPQKQVPGL